MYIIIPMLNHSEYHFGSCCAWANLTICIVNIRLSFEIYGTVYISVAIKPF